MSTATKGKGRQAPNPTENLEKILQTAIFVTMLAILSFPIISFIVNLNIHYRQDDVFIMGFYICGAISVILALMHFALAFYKNRSLGAVGMLKKLVFENTEYLLLFLYTVFIFITTAYYGFTQVGVFGLSFKREGMITFTLYVYIFFAASFLRSRKQKMFLAIWYTLIAGFLALLNVIVNTSPDIEKAQQALMLEHQIGVFSNNNHHGYFLAMTGAMMFALFILFKEERFNYKAKRDVYTFFLRHKWKLLFLLEFILTIIAIFFVESLGALVAVAGAMVILLVMYAIVKKQGKIILFTGIGAVVVVGVFVAIGYLGTSQMSGQVKEFIEQALAVFTGGEVSGDFGTGRWQLWVSTLEKIGERPFVGWGADGIWYYLGDVTNGEAQRTHNEYLQQMSFYGIPAGLCYIVGCFMVYIRAFRNRAFLTTVDLVFLAGAFAYLFGAFFGVTMVQVYPMFMVVLGLSVVENHSKEERMAAKAVPKKEKAKA